LLWACHYAAATGAELNPLHVVHDPASAPGFYRSNKEFRNEPMQTVAEDMMVSFLEEIDEEEAGLTGLKELETFTVPGLPPTRIVEVAEMLKASLIVIGSRGHTGLPHRLLGSTSERVVELSPVPVVVVKSEDYGKLGKKALKKQEKRLKKERRKLKDLLGVSKASDDGTDDG